MSEELVCIGEYHDINQASVARSRLQAEGILVFLRNEQTVAMGIGGFIPGLYTSRGGALMFVPADQVESAIAILREVDPDAVCTTGAPRPAPNARRGALKVLLAIALLGILVGTLITFAPRSEANKRPGANARPPAVAPHPQNNAPQPEKR